MFKLSPRWSNFLFQGFAFILALLFTSLLLLLTGAPPLQAYGQILL